MEDDISIPLINTQDIEILMHRDAHFGGNFSVMLEYYNEDGIGVMPDFEIERIHYLKAAEEALGSNLSVHLMPEAAVALVERSKKMYQDLRAVYEEGGVGVGQLVSDLILTESEDAKKEIDALIGNGDVAAKALLNLISSDSFFDPLYPGYGRAPALAARALSKMKYEKAIPFLFTAIGQDNFYIDEEIIQALVSFGTLSKKFLLERLQSKPYSKDNLTAIIALSSFEDDEEIAEIALTLLEDPLTFKHESFAIYLVFTGSNLKNEKNRHRFKAVSHLSHVPASIKNEMEIVIKLWR